MSPNFPYIERDESWMYFNRRLLCEAERTDLPLLERFNYLGIYSSNLDEFFRVRVASLRRLSEFNTPANEEERDRARQTLLRVARLYKDYSLRYEELLSEMMRELRQHGIHIVNECELSASQGEEVHHFYMEHISSIVNPVFICSSSFHPEKHLRESLYLVVALRPNLVLKKDGTPDLAILEIPTKACGRFIRLKDGPNGEAYIVMLDDILRFCLPYIFAGMPYTEYEAYTFKLTKDSEIELESDLRRSVIDQVSLGLKRRKRGEPIRVVYDAAMPENILNRLCELADLSKSDTLQGGGRYHNIKDMMQLPDCGRKHLRFPVWTQRQSSVINYSESILSS
ncbi:MAG: RNA degradosome polyphosphate kinase, partial [Porphyromonas sp.]|nr:RNA degradosome polyphosphate kinase [Porphyromonas sp.]